MTALEQAGITMAAAAIWGIVFVIVLLAMMIVVVYLLKTFIIGVSDLPTVHMRAVKRDSYPPYQQGYPKE